MGSHGLGDLGPCPGSVTQSLSRFLSLLLPSVNGQGKRKENIGECISAVTPSAISLVVWCLEVPRELPLLDGLTTEFSILCI